MRNSQVSYQTNISQSIMSNVQQNEVWKTVRLTGFQVLQLPSVPIFFKPGSFIPFINVLSGYVSHNFVVALTVCIFLNFVTTFIVMVRQVLQLEKLIFLLSEMYISQEHVCLLWNRGLINGVQIKRIRSWEN